MTRLGIIGLFWLALGASGCVVSEARYEEARSAVHVEQEANRRTQARLTEVSRDLDASRADLAARDKRIEKLELDVSQAKLDADVANSEKLYSIELIEQLRGELGRTGDHLREFAFEKGKLAAALDAARDHGKQLSVCQQEAADNAAVIRDLALLLHESVATGDVELAVADGRAVLRLPSSELGGETPSPVGQKLIAAVVKVSQLHADSRVRIGEVGAKAEDGDAATRLKRVADKLASAGLGGARVELRPAASGKPGPEPTLELSVFVEAPAGPTTEGSDPPASPPAG